MALKRGGTVRGDTSRDHLTDPGGRQHQHSFSSAFSFNDSTSRKETEIGRGRGKEVWKKKKNRRFTTPFCSRPPLIQNQRACRPVEKQLGVTSSFLRLHSAPIYPSFYLSLSLGGENRGTEEWRCIKNLSPPAADLVGQLFGTGQICDNTAEMPESLARSSLVQPFHG